MEPSQLQPVYDILTRIAVCMERIAKSQELLEAHARKQLELLEESEKDRQKMSQAFEALGALGG